MDNFIMPLVGHSIRLTRLVTDPTSRDNPDKQQGVIGDNLREVRAHIAFANSCYCGQEQTMTLTILPQVVDMMVFVRMDPAQLTVEAHY
jgi:hypothetical protein